MGVELSWNDVGSDWAYTVQFRESLTDGVWLSIFTQQPWPNPVPHWFDPRPASDAMCLYRVIAVEKSDRGYILESSLARELNYFEVALELWENSIPVLPLFGVQLHKLVYETLDPVGQRTLASGVVAIPTGSSGNLPLLSYQHGTMAAKDEAPSRLEAREIIIAIAYATSGYVTVMPDYLGLGDSPGIQAYHHARSEATASLDMLRAAKTYCAEQGVPLNGQLFLLGYSQGGHATLALHREIETFHADEFSITASAPMAGAYDLSGVTAEDILSGRSVPNPYYFALLVAAYQEIYHLADSLPGSFSAPYATVLPPLLDGSTSGADINAVMPGKVIEVLNPEVLQAFVSNPDHPLRVALRDNDLYDWTPRAPLQLYHCQADEDVVFANSQVAYDSFQARGAEVRLLNLDPLGDHEGCVVPSMLDAKVWFDLLKE